MGVDSTLRLFFSRDRDSHYDLIVIIGCTLLARWHICIKTAWWFSLSGWKYHYRDKIVMRVSYHYNEHQYFGMVSLYWNISRVQWWFSSLRPEQSGILQMTFSYALISNHIHYNEWDEITYPFPNFNSAAVEVWDRISNFIPHFSGHVITYPWWDLR